DGDYRSTGDNVVPSETSTEAWETPATINDTWGYRTDETNWKSPGQIAFKLVDIVSKGGNYLLNVGPTAEGVIPQASQDVLRTVGRWLQATRDAVCGAGPRPSAGGRPGATGCPGPARRHWGMRWGSRARRARRMCAAICWSINRRSG